MKSVWFEIAVALATCLLSGCGNSDFESAVYRECCGSVRCLQCANVVGEAHKNHFIKFGVYNSEGCEYCKKEAGDKFRCGNSDIDSIKSESAGIKDVWNVEISYRCPLHGEGKYRWQYSYKNKVLHFLKSL